ncbi:MAG: PAS domain S-box protein [Pontiellaceae bacterium]|nr:PAS domain S-box protein [Pontiellaceae bacterium]
MSPHRSLPVDPALRKKAEALLSATKKELQEYSPEQLQELLHELDILRTELELQNEELRDAQTSLSASFSRYNELFNNAPIGYVTLDSSGIIRQTNTTWLKMLNREDSNLLGTPFADLLLPDDATVFLSRFRTVFRNLDEKQIEVRVRRPSPPGFFHALVSSQPRRTEPESSKELLVAVSDISELKRAKETIDQFFEQPLHLHIITGLDGVIQRVNSSWEQTLGYSPQELTGRNILEFIHPDDLEATQKEMNKLAKGQKVFHFANRYHHKDGNWRTMEWSSSVPDEGKVIYGIASDITEREEAKRALRARNNELNMFNKAAVGRELRMMEMKMEVNALCRELGREEPYI